MASAKLLQRSGDGNNVGLDGLELFEHYYVEVDAEGDDPIDVLQDRLEDDPFSRTGVPLGQSHPDPKYVVAQVRNYIPYGDPIGHLGRLVLVRYSTPEIPPIAQTTIPKWRFSTSVISRTRKLDRDLDNKLIGSRAVAFSTTTGTSGPAYKAYSKAKDADIDVKLLGDDTKDGGAAVGDVGLEVEDGIFAITLTRVTMSMSTSTLRASRDALFKANSAIWYGYPAKSILIADIRISEEEYHKQGSSRTNQYPVSVELWHQDGDWTKQTLPVIYDEEGKAAPVRVLVEGQDKALVSEYKVRNTTDLAGFLRRFEVTSP